MKTATSNPSRLMAILCTLVVLSGCAAQRHTSQMRSVKDAIVKKGEYHVAALEKEVYSANRKIKSGAHLIDMLELGSVYPLGGDFANSNQILEAAYVKYTQREERAKINARDATSGLLDILIGEGSGEYDMAAYEKVYIHNIKAMNYLILGRPDAARVEVQRAVNTHQRIKEYAEFKTAQIAREKASVRRLAEENEVANPDVDAQVRRLTSEAALDRSQQKAIRHMRNSYENGYTYLLSALVFGLNREPENARPQLKNATALTTNRYVKRLFRDFEKDPASLTAKTNVYVFAQVGFAPYKKNLQVPFYNPVSETLTNFSLARIQPSPASVSAIDIVDAASKVNGPMETLADLDLLALKQYDEDLPGNITKAILRIVTQTIKDKAVLDELGQKGRNLNLFKIQAGVLSAINQVVYKADIRAWNLAPKRVLFYSGTVRSPAITLSIRDAAGKLTDRTVAIDPGRLNLVSLRCCGPKVFIHSQTFGGS